jgi:hypothetical protein
MEEAVEMCVAALAPPSSHRKVLAASAVAERSPRSGYAVPEFAHRGHGARSTAHASLRSHALHAAAAVAFSPGAMLARAARSEARAWLAQARAASARVSLERAGSAYRRQRGEPCTPRRGRDALSVITRSQRLEAAPSRARLAHRCAYNWLAGEAVVCLEPKVESIMSSEHRSVSHTRGADRSPQRRLHGRSA